MEEYFLGLYILIANIFGIFETNLYQVSIILCILIILINIKYFKNILIKLNLNKDLNIYLIYLLSFITIFNFSYMDNMNFIEMPIIALSILFYIISAKKVVIDQAPIKMSIYLLIAIFMYQGTINVFFIMTLFLLLNKYKKLNKNVMLGEFKILILSIIPVAINYIYMLIYGSLFTLSERLTSSYTNIQEIIYNSLTVIKDTLTYSKGIMPKNFYIIIILITIILFLILKYKKKQYVNEFINIIVLIIYSIISCLPLILIFKINDINNIYYARKTILGN